METKFKEWDSQFLVDLRRMQYRVAIHDKYFESNVYNQTKIDQLKHYLMNIVKQAGVLAGAKHATQSAHVPLNTYEMAFASALKNCLSMANLVNVDISNDLKVNTHYLQGGGDAEEVLKRLGLLADTVLRLSNFEPSEGNLHGLSAIVSQVVTQFYVFASMYLEFFDCAEREIIRSMFIYLETTAREDIHYDRKNLAVIKELKTS